MVNIIFILLYISVILMPNFRSLDIVSSQGLYLNILNLISTSFLVYKYYKRKQILPKFKEFSSYTTISFLLFLIWCLLSILWALNKSEGIRTVTEIFTFIVAFLNIIINIKELPKKPIDIIFSLLVVMQFVELFYLFIPYLDDILKGIYRGGSMTYNGLTGNKNIAAFSILIKTPILYYFLFNKNTKIYFKIPLYFILLLSIISIFFVTETRAAELSFILLIIFLGFSILFKRYIEFEFLVKRIKKFIYLIILTTFPFLLGKMISSNTVDIGSNLSSLTSETTINSNERLKFYKYALEIISENFFTGKGIGSWELESIEKDRLEMRSYVVPYHVHNDILEIFSETGIFGVVFFYSPFFLVYFSLFYLILKNSDKSEKSKVVIIFLCLSMYLADALINFPFARVIQNINLIFILCCGILVLESHLKLNYKFLNYFSKYLNPIRLILTLLILSPLSLYSSFRLFESGRDQSLLLYAFNQNNFEIFKKDELEKIEIKYPNLTGTALPIATIIGIHYYYLNDLELAERYLREGTIANPYLNISQSYTGKVFEKKGELDSAKYYTKLAFDKMPNNPVHFAHYIQILSKTNDTLAIKEAYDQVTYKERDPRFENLYLLAMSRLIDKDEGRFILNDIKKNQLKSDGLKASYYILELGEKRVKEAYINYLKAETYFKNNDFSSAAKYYDLASELNPLENPYIENAAISYLKIGKLEEAMARIDKVIENLDLTTEKGKTFYVKALVYLEKDERKLACEYFEKALNEGFNTKMVLNSYCK